MKKCFGQATRTAIVVGISLLSTSTSFAAPAKFPRMARGFGSWLVRAMDECSPSTLSVAQPPIGLPGGGCPPTNAVTDALLGLKFGKVRVTSRGAIALFASGFVGGDSMRVRLTLRVTKAGLTVKHPPGTNKTVTFVDATADCPKAPAAFVARPNGAVVGRTTLASCLAPLTGLAQGNIEILDASLINTASGKVVGVPGVLR